MSEEAEKDNEIREEAKSAADAEVGNLRDLVRDITLRALTQRKLDKDSIERAVRLVTEGLTEGLKGKEDEMETKVKSALSGVDDALKKSAQAAKLATEEALGEAKDFVQEDLQKSLRELASLEDLFLDTVNKVSEQGTQLANSVVSRLAGHLKNSGTSAGQEAKEAAKHLQDQLAALSKQGATTAVDTGRTLSEQISQVASGILSGMSDALNPKEKQ